MLREELPAGERQNAEIGAVLTAMDPFLGAFIDEVRTELKRKVDGDSVVEGSEVKYISKQRVVYYISATQDDPGEAFSFSTSFTQGDALVTSAPSVGAVSALSNQLSTGAGTAGSLAGTVTTQGALTVTAGGAGTTATGQFVTELEMN